MYYSPILNFLLNLLYTNSHLLNFLHSSLYSSESLSYNFIR
nr:MAG TPA: hypothetical protein [Caudoviricetes sp.]